MKHLDSVDQCSLYIYLYVTKNSFNKISIQFYIVFNYSGIFYIFIDLKNNIFSFVLYKLISIRNPTEGYKILSTFWYTSWFDYWVVVRQIKPRSWESKIINQMFSIHSRQWFITFSFTCGLQCSSSQVNTQADNSAKLATDTLSKVWNKRSIMAWNWKKCFHEQFECKRNYGIIQYFIDWTGTVIFSLKIRV